MSNSSYSNVAFMNRLDRDTTGLTLLAKHMLSASILSGMVKNRMLKREYLAICEGSLPQTEGVIDAPIGRAEGSTIERKVDYETGRTHQIRIHMKHIGHPLVGDFLYHPNMQHISRQALNSHRLTFLHPITKEPLFFEVPLPDDMNFF